MAGLILPDEFLTVVLKKFLRCGDENDSAVFMAMQTFLNEAKKNEESLTKARTYIENDTAIKTFIETVRSSRQDRVEAERNELINEAYQEAYQKAKTDASAEVEFSFNAKSFNEINDYVKKIDGATALALEMLRDAREENAELKEMLRDTRKENVELRKEVKETHDKLDGAKDRSIRYFRTTLPISLTGLTIALTSLSLALTNFAAKYGWFGFKKEGAPEERKPKMFIPEPAIPPKEQHEDKAAAPTVQESKPPANEIGTPKSQPALTASGEPIPLQFDSLRGPCDPLTGRRMIELLEREKFLLPNKPGIVFYFDCEPSLPGPRRKYATTSRPEVK